MITISLCMIVKNEEKVLARCLRGVRNLVDEIVVVDTGSTDRTKEIAAEFADKILDFPWIDDFSAARNFAFAQAAMEYVLWLDADDILLPEDAVKFRRLKQTLSPDTDAVMMRYHTGFDEQGRVTFSYYRGRLVRRSRGFRWREPVHEFLEIGGNILRSEVSITHAKEHGPPGDRNIRIYEALLAQGKALSPRGTYYYARELRDRKRFTDAIRVFQQFLDEGRGWVEDNIVACGELARCHQAQGDESAALAAMLRSFTFDTPRAELCCQIGYHFKSREAWRQAAFWFSLAASLEKPQDSWGFHQEDCWEYIPCLECAVCYDKLGNLEKAEQYNNRAAACQPDAPAVLHNTRYFQGRRQTQTGTAKEEAHVAADISEHITGNHTR